MDRTLSKRASPPCSKFAITFPCTSSPLHSSEISVTEKEAAVPCTDSRAYRSAISSDASTKRTQLYEISRKSLETQKSAVDCNGTSARVTSVEAPCGDVQAATIWYSAPTFTDSNATCASRKRDCPAFAARYDPSHS